MSTTLRCDICNRTVAEKDIHDVMNIHNENNERGLFNVLAVELPVELVTIKKDDALVNVEYIQADVCNLCMDAADIAFYRAFELIVEKST